MSAQLLGFDSCGIFYIGGKVAVSQPWDLWQVERLAAVAGDDDELDVYEDKKNVPGQPWDCYRCGKKKGNETRADQNLGQRLRDLLEPSSYQWDLDNIPKREGFEHYKPYLRLKHKPMDKTE